mmetsp:Transcript_27736/g.77712  ORF Transcript_27736/g.77712 Transcript_27736/m.77712 type:complete len:207 (-) Transcript_27736:1025-1645(-)
MNEKSFTNASWHRSRRPKTPMPISATKKSSLPRRTSGNWRNGASGKKRKKRSARRRRKTTLPRSRLRLRSEASTGTSARTFRWVATTISKRKRARKSKRNLHQPRHLATMTSLTSRLDSFLDSSSRRMRRMKNQKQAMTKATMMTRRRRTAIVTEMMMTMTKPKRQQKMQSPMRLQKQSRSLRDRLGNVSLAKCVRRRSRRQESGI